MKILLVASNRPWKSIEPLESVEADFQTVVLNPARPKISNLVMETVDILRKSIAYKPDIIFCHAAKYISLTALVLAKLIARPFAVRIAGDIFEDYRTRMAYCKRRGRMPRLIYFWLTHKVELFVIHHSSGIITVADHLRETLLSQAGRDLTRIEVVPVACDISRFAHAPVDAISNTEFRGKKIILTVTNLDFEEKLAGLKEALPGLTHVLAQRQDVVLLIAGGGFFFNDIKSYIERSHQDLFNKKKIILLGFVEEIEKLYAIADMVVYYSLRDGWPNVMLEAWASGKPLIVNDSYWSREHVQRNTALIARDGRELIEYVEMLLDSEQARKELSDKGYEYVSQNCSNEAVGRKLAQALSNLIRKPPARGGVKGVG